jgi:hypothetical protein
VNYGDIGESIVALAVPARWLRRNDNLAFHLESSRRFKGLCPPRMDFLAPNHYVYVAHRDF